MISPTMIRILIVTAMAFALFGAGWKAGAGSVQAKWDKERVVLMQSAADAEKSARETEVRMSKKIQEAQNAATEREKTLRAERDTALAATRSLRNTIAARRDDLPGNTADACRSTADAALSVLGECADKYQRMAETADGHISDVRMMQEAWPK